MRRLSQRAVDKLCRQVSGEKPPEVAPLSPRIPSLALELWKKVTPVKVSNELTPCWFWQGQLDRDSRPVHQGRSARRLAYSAWISAPTPGSDILVICQQKRCINPLHLHDEDHDYDNL